MEELLREAACYGKVDDVRDLVSRGVDVNSQHIMNKWTALHWAAKRNHSAVVQYLIESGADKTLRNDSGKTPFELATDRSTLLALGATLAAENCSESDTSHETSQENVASFTPSYMALMRSDGKCSLCHQPLHRPSRPRCEHTGTQTEGMLCLPNAASLLVVKVRRAGDEDFIEVDLDCDCLTFGNFMDTLCAELGVERSTVAKIRKCPNTLIRNDRDVSRLHEFQEIELVTRSGCL